MLKWIIGIIIVVLAGAALWWSGWLGSFTPSQTATTTPEASQPAAEQPLNGMSPSADTSDAALSQDQAAIDAQLQGLTQDQASVDASLSDQPVTQSY